jgi:hypothetical protein
VNAYPISGGEADQNRDGVVDALDVQEFIEGMNNGPE